MFSDWLGEMLSSVKDFEESVFLKGGKLMGIFV